MKIDFYQKKGCINNTKQIQLLEDKGHVLNIINIFDAHFTPSDLRKFFGNKPVMEWFNPTAPRIKNGEVVPEQLSENQAIDEMIADRFLIKRPLITLEDEHCSGFDNDLVTKLLDNPNPSTIRQNELLLCHQVDAKNRCV